MGFIIPQNQRMLDWRKLSQDDLVILSLTLFLTPVNNFVQICCIVLSYNMWHWKGKSKFWPHTYEDSKGILKYEKKQQRTCAAEELMSLWSKSHIQHQGQLVPFQSQPSNQYHNVLQCFNLSGYSQSNNGLLSDLFNILTTFAWEQNSMQRKAFKHYSQEPMNTDDILLFASQKKWQILSYSVCQNVAWLSDFLRMAIQ